MKILVTGGAGFLGSHVCERLLSEEQEVICVDNLSSGSRQNIERFEGDSNFELLNQDIRHVNSLPPIDRIYHLASRASPKDFTEYPVEIALSNTQGTRRLLDHARATDAKMVFASTSEVYGNPEIHPQSETYNGNVNIRGIRGCYDESKRFGETLTVAYRRRHGLDTRSVRIFNTYGPRMRPDDGRVIPNFVTQALRGDDLTVYGDGEQTRSFCYVDDLVDGIISYMRLDEPEYRVINLGRENERTINELAHIIIDMTDTESEIAYEPLPEDDPSKRRPDLTRAEEILNWNSKTTLQDGLEQTVSYFKTLIEKNTMSSELDHD